MQSNIYTNKIHKQRQKDAKPSKQEASEKTSKQAHKGKSWKRDNTKRNFDFNVL